MDDALIKHVAKAIEDVAKCVLIYDGAELFNSEKCAIAAIEAVNSYKHTDITGSSNGRTSDFDSDNRGSSPRPVTTTQNWEGSGYTPPSECPECGYNHWLRDGICTIKSTKPTVD